MSSLLSPDDFERAAKVRGETMVDVCVSAHVAYTTFWRWKNGKSGLTLPVYERLYEAVTAPLPRKTETVEREA